MIFSETKLNVNDNSGAKKVKCIKVLKCSKVFGGKPGDVTIISIRKVRKNKNVIKGDVSRGIIVRTKKKINRFDGSGVRFSDNSLALIDKKNMPISSRMTGLVAKELRYKDFPKVYALARFVI